MTGVSCSTAAADAGVVAEWIRESVGEEDPDEGEEIVLFLFFLSTPVTLRLPAVEKNRDDDYNPCCGDH